MSTVPTDPYLSSLAHKCKQIADQDGDSPRGKMANELYSEWVNLAAGEAAINTIDKIVQAHASLLARITQFLIPKPQQDLADDAERIR